MRDSAEWLVATLRTVGFPRVEVWPTDGAPAIFAQWHGAPGAPTVLVYSHHDVRTVHEEQWQQSEPFRPTVKAGRLHGRGSSDAKGQVAAHLWALRALLGTGHEAPPVNVTLLVEGEEELGSPHLADCLAAHDDELAADFVVLSDTMTWAADRPAVCTGIRGMMQAEVEIHGPVVDVHAGSVSGAAPNPLSEIARLVAALHDPAQRVTVPGFYDDVIEPEPDERAALAALSDDESDWVMRTGVRAVQGESGYGVGELLYDRPAAEVIMLAAGEPAPPTTGTIPSSASARIQVSLVPEQKPDAIAEKLRRWVTDTVRPPFRATVQVADMISQPPYLTPPDHPALAALTEAMSDAWGCPVGRMRNAGSAPTALLAAATDAPVLFFGTGLPEDRWHGPDESVDLDVLLAGALTLSLFWSRVGSVAS
ncbi:MAG: M20/M25/M40 family metallo-hydrolase [Actinobacteria bacterium]|nr:M20/M25/M40 family metallo-hydrolase [Actinomycetota bacterium]